LSGIPGLAVAELDDGERCCGSAGIYNITHPALAAPLAALKLDAILAAGARAVSAANPGCLIQIASEAQRRGIELRVCHPVELIAEALPSSTPSSV
jgi:glycolate oxidase iron-sulfur subunit